MPLLRRLSLADAVAIGLGAMIGAGVFAVWGPAIGAAGSGVGIALAIAAVIAFCNATSSSRLAAAYAVSGGVYAYGRAELGPWWGYAAGWCFVIGKLASCAAMAMTFAAYVAPSSWRIPVAVAAVVALTIVTSVGITRTARLTRILVTVALIGLAVVVIAAGIALPDADPAPLPDPTAYGVLQGAGLLFFAFAGYARIATMGEEVRDPATTIPRAVSIALGAALAVYLLVGGAVVLTLGGDAAASASPLTDVVARAGWGAGADVVVRATAAAASLGALLALLGGIGRTTLAMARERDLPHALARIDPVHRVPRRAQLAAGVVVVAIVLVADLRGAIGFSSFGVLLYYFVANAAAFAQRPEGRRLPRALPVVGAIGCLTLVLALPPLSSAIGAAVVAVGLLLRALRLSLDRRRGTPMA
ncbi:APA family basic amino acid/polyamine antiporter [Microbacterium resistens]|uniref:APA family basic amino acid/polyamine antiporter n=1 Tax=Microbacterium resistens TaxID=156977 RepID=A0ABU1S7S6_9MICO|nr:APC family permease [Microbacterium resistens]MDR6865645.1 APA family basic amino acid/polyamine antiporter [Microbacterium resistens]